MLQQSLARDTLSPALLSCGQTGLSLTGRPVDIYIYICVLYQRQLIKSVVIFIGFYLCPLQLAPVPCYQV